MFFKVVDKKFVNKVFVIVFKVFEKKDVGKKIVVFGEKKKCIKVCKEIYFFYIYKGEWYFWVEV